MNFDDEDDSDFNVASAQSGNKLASLFKSNVEPSSSNESLKYKAPKQPQPAATAQPAAAGQAPTSSTVLFSSTVKAFKYQNNKYEDQGRLGLAVLLSTANGLSQHKLLLYTTSKQTVGAVQRLAVEFRVSVQKSNYVSFYDDQKQLWSILFDSEELVASFATQVVLCKCNILQGIVDGHKLHQELKVSDSASSDSDLSVEATDSVEVANVTRLVKEQKLVEIENNAQKPFRFKLGKNKLPQIIEDLLVGMKQGDRKLLVLNGNGLKSVYPNAAGFVVFYDITVMRIKKSNKDEAMSSGGSEQMPPLPQLGGHLIPGQMSPGDAESRSRAESIREKTKMISEQLTDPKSEKAKLISRMAKMGQQMLPPGGGAAHDTEEDWNASSTISADQTAAFIQQQQMQEAMANQNAQMAAAAKTALLLQNQQLQQQLLNQAWSAANNPTSAYNPGVSGAQLALYKPPSSFLLQQPPADTPFVQQYQQQPTPQPAQIPANPGPELASIQSKLDLIGEKLEAMRASQQSNLPNMETSVVLHNIQRLVKENDQYKKDLFEKGAKIEEQNAKITEMLSKQQSYVEQSHQILESKNSTFQVTSERAQQRVLELEKDKVALTQELTESTGRISELNMEINRLRKDDIEIRQQLTEVSKNTDQYKQSMERLTLENADLQTKLDAASNELKKERLARKSIESKLQLSEDEVSEMRSSAASMQKLVDERKRKAESDRAQADADVEEMKRAHHSELLVLKDKIARLKSDSSEAQTERARQIEEDLVAEWRAKMEQALEQAEQKYERRVGALEAELGALRKQMEGETVAAKTLRLEMAEKQAECDQLKHEIEDLHVIRDKYERLKSQAIVMKERYEARIKEVLDAAPDAEVVGEEIKKLMNSMYRRLKAQIKPEEYYSGNGILTAMLKMIKLITLQMLNNEQQPSEQEDVDVDYFSQHIYQAPPAPPPQPHFVPPAQSSAIETTDPVVVKQESQPVEVSSPVKLNESPGYDEVDNRAEETPVQIVKEPVAVELDQSTNSEEKTDEESREVATPTTTTAEATKEEEEDDEAKPVSDEISSSSSTVMVTVAAVAAAASEIKADESNDSEYDLVEDVGRNGAHKNEEIINFSGEQTQQQEVVQAPNETTEEKVEEKSQQVEVGHSEEDAAVPEPIEEQEKAKSGEIAEDVPESVPIQDATLKEDDEEENEEEDGLFGSSKPPPLVVKSISSKGLFDDVEEEDDNSDLFSSSKPTVVENKTVVKEDKKPDDNQQSATTSATPLNLKFSPPPLFDDEDDKEIDWFK